MKDEEYGLTDYDDAKISKAVNIFCTFFAPLLTTVPMFVLYFVPDIQRRLGIIMGFTTLFSIRSVTMPFLWVDCWYWASTETFNSLGLFSSARRIEVFAATSAFAAVQVVYVAVNH